MFPTLHQNISLPRFSIEYLAHPRTHTPTSLSCVSPRAADRAISQPAARLQTLPQASPARAAAWSWRCGPMPSCEHISQVGTAPTPNARVKDSR